MLGAGVARRPVVPTRESQSDVGRVDRFAEIQSAARTTGLASHQHRGCDTAHEQSPAFQFYPKDFLADGNVAGMSMAERGAYITLLCVCWREGSLPMDTKRLAHMVGATHQAFARVWPAVQACFEEQDGRLVHKRLDKERAKQAEFRAQQSAAGKASAAKRASRQPKGNGRSTGVQPEPQPNGNRNPSLLSPISDLQSPDFVRRQRGQPPLAMNLKRLKFWRWMAEAMIAQLGPHADEFDLDAWVHERDDTETRVITGDWWAYWLSAFEAEVCRRGLPIAAAPAAGKLTTRLAAAMENIRREAES